MIVKVLGETFPIKERKIKTQGRRFIELKHKLKVIRICYLIMRLSSGVQLQKKV